MFTAAKSSCRSACGCWATAAVVVLVGARENDLFCEPMEPKPSRQLQAVLQVNGILDFTLMGRTPFVEHSLDRRVHAGLFPFQLPADIEQHLGGHLKVGEQTKPCVYGRGGQRYAKLLPNLVEFAACRRSPRVGT